MKDNVEQKPSEDEMNRVRPSLDHARSVNVAQWRLLTTQIGVFCCVSYSRTESCVATAYTILYGKEKAGLGPGVDAFVSTVKRLAAATSLDGVGRGGGSITGAGEGGLDNGSGRDGISSAAVDVSIAMVLVSKADARSV